jgi:protein-disulfide isomerase
MHDQLYANIDDLSEESIVKRAADLGLDLQRFAADRADSTTANRIRAEKRQGVSFGVKSTPGIFVNGKLYRGPKTYQDLEDRLEEELEILATPEGRP